MNAVMPSKQRGLSLTGLLVGAVILIFASILGMKLIPAYMQDAQIKNIFTIIANDPEMQDATPRAILQSFSNRADVDNVTAIKAEDIDIAKDEGRLVLSASYEVRIPMVSNISLLLEFSPSSDK